MCIRGLAAHPLATAERARLWARIGLALPWTLLVAGCGHPPQELVLQSRWQLSSAVLAASALGPERWLLLFDDASLAELRTAAATESQRSSVLAIDVRGVSAGRGGTILQLSPDSILVIAGDNRMGLLFNPGTHGPPVSASLAEILGARENAFTIVGFDQRGSMHVIEAAEPARRGNTRLQQFNVVQVDRRSGARLRLAGGLSMPWRLSAAVERGSTGQVRAGQQGRRVHYRALGADVPVVKRDGAIIVLRQRDGRVEHCDSRGNCTWAVAQVRAPAFETDDDLKAAVLAVWRDSTAAVTPRTKNELLGGRGLPLFISGSFSGGGL